MQIGSMFPVRRAGRFASLAIFAVLSTALRGAGVVEPAATVVDLCQASPLARAHCSVLVSVPDMNRTQGIANATPTGYGPADIKSAYNLDTTKGAGRTVAIIGAYNAQYAETDLAAYRSNYGLPPCTSETGCFKKLNQNGAASPLPGNSPTGDDWDAEYALQMDMVSAACPLCNILLVEANNDEDYGLYIAVNTAAAQPGVVAIALPYGGEEYLGETADEQAYFNHPGIALVAAGGDDGYGVVFPAASQYVVSVGATHLATAANSRGWTETAWTGTGSGCSKYIAKPVFQTDTDCSMRTANDVAVVGDPNTGVEAYSQRDGGWFPVGGTTVGSGIIAGVFALAGPPTFPGRPAAALYRQARQLYDVTSGTNGSCSGTYLCVAELGYDGPTGNGTPNGYAAFVDDTVFMNGFD